MKQKIISLLCCSLSAMYAISQDAAAPISIIPEPAKMVQTTGTFTLPNAISIEAPDLPTVTTTVNFLETHLKPLPGIQFRIASRLPMQRSNFLSIK